MTLSFSVGLHQFFSHVHAKVALLLPTFVVATRRNENSKRVSRYSLSQRIRRSVHRENQLTRTQVSNRRLLVEGLEVRYLMAAAPVARDDSAYFASLNTDLVITTSSSQSHLLVNDFDVDGGTQTVSVVTNPTNGSLVSFNSNGTFTYRPNTGFTGVDSFTYKINDGSLDSNVAVASIAVATKLIADQTPDTLGSQALNPEFPFQDADTSNRLASSFRYTDASGSLRLNESVLPGLDLAYRSNATLKPIISIDTALATGAAVPDSITAQLTFNGVAGTSYSYSTSGMTTGQAMHFALQADGTALATGMYSYSVVIGLKYGATTINQTFTGQQAIVNRSASEFGSGWWLNGLDRLVDSSTGALLVKGDGSTFWFGKTGATYTHAAGDTDFNTLVKTGTNTFTLTSKYGNVANFSTLGLLTSVVDTNSNTTSFAYADRNSNGVADELVSITDPFSRVTNLNYTSGKVSSIAHFSGRTTTLAVSSGLLTSYTLTDPDGAGALVAPQFSFGYTSGALTSRTNPHSQITSFAYSTNDGRLRSITYPNTPSNQVWSITPPEVIGLPTATTGNVVSTPVSVQGIVTDERNQSWKFRTDRFGKLTEWITPLQFQTSYSRDADGQEIIQILPDPDGTTGPLGLSIFITGYNAFGDTVYSQAPDNGVTTAVYSSSLHRLLSTIDPVGRTQSFTYSTTGNRLTSTDGAGFVTTTAFNSRGLPTSITAPDPDGAGALTAPVTGLTYDSFGRVITITNPDSSTQTFTYNTADDRLTVTDELAKTTTSVYDSLGRRTSITDRTGAATQFTFDGLSRVTRVTDALGNQTDTTYNSRGWIASIAYPDPDGAGALVRPVDNRYYDAVGNSVSIGYESNNYQSSVLIEYDIDNRLTKRDDPSSAGLARRFLYDNQNRLLWQGVGVSGASAPTNITKYTYDTAGRRTIETVQSLIEDPYTGPTIYSKATATYTLAGQKASETDGRGNTKSFSYNSRGLLATETLPDPDSSGSQFGNVISHVYDNMGREIQTFDGVGRTSNQEYNSRSWLTKFTDQDPDGAGALTAPVTLIGYNLRGDRTSITDPLNRVTTTTYDFEQRPLSMTSPDPDGAGALTSPVVSQTYNGVGWIVSETSARGGVTTRTFDNAGRILTETSPDPDGAGPLVAPVSTNIYNDQGLWKVTDALNRTTIYGRDGRGRVTSVTDPVGNVTSYEYDYWDKLTKQTDPDPDGAGSLVSPVTNYQYDPVQRLTLKTDPRNGNTSYSYDKANNRVSLTDSVGNTTNFGYDGQNRLVLNTNSLSKSKSYVYDVTGNLTRTVDRNGQVIQHVFDGLDRKIQENWQQNASPTPTLTVTTSQEGGSINEVQRVGWTSAQPISGTFTISLSGQTTTALTQSATAVQVQTALEALSTVGTGNVLVELITSPSNPYDRSFRLTFIGSKAATNMAQATINVSSLLGYYYTPTAVQVTDIQGGIYSETQQVVLANATGGTGRLAFNGSVTAPLASNATATQVQTALNALQGIGTVSVTGSAGTFTVTFGGTTANTNVSSLFGDAATASSGTNLRSIVTVYNAADEVTSITDPSATIAYTRDALGRATTISNTIAGLTPNVSFLQAFDSSNNRTE